MFTVYTSKVDGVNIICLQRKHAKTGAMAIRVPRKPHEAYQHGNLRHALIQAGLRLLSESGVHGLSLRAAAQLAGVSHTAPYRHFADKDALVAAIAEEGFMLFTEALRAGVAGCTSTRVVDRLRDMAAAYVSFAQDHPAYLGVMFGGVVNKDKVPPSLQAAGQAAYMVLRDLVEEGVRTGELRPGHVDEIALACWSMTHGLSMLLMDRGLPQPVAHVGSGQDVLRNLLGRLEVGIAGGARGKAVRTPPDQA